jgi:predicted dinucleotide-binding enzyme
MHVSISMSVKTVKKYLNLYKVIVAFTALMAQWLAHQSKKAVKVHVVGKSDNKNTNIAQSYRHADVSVCKGSLRLFQKNLHPFG